MLALSPVLAEWYNRFGGSEFPPVILFKVFLSGACGHAQYFSGKEVIQPATNVRRERGTKEGRERGREGGSKGVKD